jgi:hypothetical protein
MTTTGTTNDRVRLRTPDPTLDTTPDTTPDTTVARDGSAFSAPHERHGVTLFTATRSHTRRDGTVTTRPVGAFVIRHGKVRWHPAVDATRLLTTTEVVSAPS